MVSGAVPHELELVATEGRGHCGARPGRLGRTRWSGGGRHCPAVGAPGSTGCRHRERADAASCSGGPNGRRCPWWCSWAVPPTTAGSASSRLLRSASPIAGRGGQPRLPGAQVPGLRPFLPGVLTYCWEAEPSVLLTTHPRTGPPTTGSPVVMPTTRTGCRRGTRTGSVRFEASFLAGLPPGGVVADLGCGPAVDGARLASKGCRVVGVDISAGMLRIAAEGLDGRVVQADLRDLPSVPAARRSLERRLAAACAGRGHRQGAA